MTNLTKILLPFLLFLFAGICEGKKVLFVGNSYTSQCAKTLTGLFRAESPDWELAFLTKGGKDLAFHLADPACVEKIRSGGWDFVVLQEQSQKSGLGGEFTKGFHQAVDALAKLIRDAGAKPCLYMTWGRRAGDRRNPKAYPDFETMQQKITAAYLQAAKANDAIIVPVGPAFAATKKSGQQRFDALYKKDGSHPSAAGAYLVSCVFWSRLTGKDPNTIRWAVGMDKVEAGHLRQAADPFPFQSKP